MNNILGMNAGINGLSSYNLNTYGINQSTSASSLESALTNNNLENATDQELMDVCKSFESYFVEQVIKGAKSSILSEEDEGEYMQYFGDTLIQSYADIITESGDLGIAQMLYESMKRN